MAEMQQLGEILKQERIEKQEIITESFFRVNVIGIGGCGCNIMTRLMSMGLRKNLYALNTDALQLRSISDKITRLLIGRTLTRGLGAGGSHEVGAKAMLESIENVKKIVGETDLAILAVGLGGGTGTGGVIPLTKHLKEMGVSVIVVATIPFRFERAKREKTKVIMKELAAVADSVILFDNEKLVEKASALGLNQAFMVIDGHIASLINALNNSFNTTSLMNIDYSDLKTLFTNANGFATFSVATVPNEKDLMDIPKQMENDMVLGNRKSAKGLMLHLEAEEKIPIGDAIRILNEASSGISKNAETSIGVFLGKNHFYARVFSVYMGIEIDVDGL